MKAVRIFFLSLLLSTLRSFTIAPQSRVIADRSNVNKLLFSAQSDDDIGQVGQGPNWIERSFPVQTDEKVDPKSLDDYNLGISGISFETGPLSARMYDAIVSRSSLDTSDPDVIRALKLCAMDFTAKEATRAALSTNGLEMVLSEDEENQGMWGDVDTIRILNAQEQQVGPEYDSFEEAVDYWKPGQSFSFVVRQVPAKLRELTLEELLQALDPDGKLRQEAREAGMMLPDEGLISLHHVAQENKKRSDRAPRGVCTEIYTGTNKRGYRVMAAKDLAERSKDGTEVEATLMHLMNAFVSHGCLLVDVTNGGVDMNAAKTMSKMWKVAQKALQSDGVADKLPPMQTIEAAGSYFAKVGYAEYDGGDMKFLETRWKRDGKILPEQLDTLVDTIPLRDAFDLVAAIVKNAVRVAVAASSMEAEALNPQQASDAAFLLANELVDDRQSLKSDTDHTETSVCMSPHRLCQYANTKESSTEAREVFGAHTDSTFLTVVPVAAVAGLEVYDEDAEQWYRPELKAREHWISENGEGLSKIVDGEEIPWHARYVALLPGELLQVVTRNEIMASVHRVVATVNDSPRLSAPILLRGRSGIKMNVRRYLGDSKGDPLLEECDTMTFEDIHNAMQPANFSKKQ